MYNTTQRILVNGHGFANFVEKFLKPFFESKLSLNLEDIASYNKQVIATLGPRQVKRVTVKYKGGLSFSCKVCHFSAKTIASLKKHKCSDQALGFNSSKSISTDIAPIRQSTRNNSMSEVLLKENMSITNVSNNSARVTLEANLLKYTCLECNYATSKNLN